VPLSNSTVRRRAPREVRITKAIGEVKKAILKGSARADPIRSPPPGTAERAG
jgi:hypothetical protein